MAAPLVQDERPVTGRATFTAHRAFLGHRSRSQSLLLPKLRLFHEHFIQHYLEITRGGIFSKREIGA